MGGGQAPDGNPSEQPSGDSGDSQNGGTPPELPADGAGQGSAPADDQAPDASGQQPQGGAPDANGSAPEKPADDGQGTDSTGGDTSSFYGVGAAALVTDGTLKISDSTISTDAKGGAGVFAYGDGTACVSDTTITTKQDTSGGIHVAGGGTLYAWDLNVETNGESSAAIRSDRGWGQSGANGADCSFTARNQTMEGDVIWDSISQLDFYMLDGSTLTGAVLDDETNAGNGGDGGANLYISADSTWVVTGDSVLTNLYSAGTIVDAQGLAVTIVDTDGTVLVQGTSDCTVPVRL